MQRGAALARFAPAPAPSASPPHSPPPPSAAGRLQAARRPQKSGCSPFLRTPGGARTRDLSLRRRKHFRLCYWGGEKATPGSGGPGRQTAPIGELQPTIFCWLRNQLRNHVFSKTPYFWPLTAQSHTLTSPQPFLRLSLVACSDQPASCGRDLNDSVLRAAAALLGHQGLLVMIYDPQGMLS